MGDDSFILPTWRGGPLPSGGLPASFLGPLEAMTDTSCCPYCGLATTDTGHIKIRHGITPETHATALESAVMPDLPAELTRSTGGLWVPKKVTEPGGYL